MEHPDLHDSAVLPFKQDLHRNEKHSSRSVDQVEQVDAPQKEAVGTPLTQFDIFQHVIKKQDQILLIQNLRALHGREYTTPYSTSSPDIEALAQRCLSWIVNEDVPHLETNFVSQLASHALAQILEDSLDGELISTFQDFILATTLAYTAWRDQRSPSQRLSVQDLHRASHLTGSSLLQQLDQHVDFDTLSKAPRPTLQAVFLVVFGTTLGVAYSVQMGGQPSTVPPDLLCATARERLCNLLADKLIFLASLIWEVDTAAARRCVVDGCLMGRWSQSGRYIWGNLMPHYIWPPSDHSLNWFVHRPFGAIRPAPHAAVMRCPEVSSPLLPRMDSSDKGKRRSMLVVGPTLHGQHMYARMRTHVGSDGPSLFV